MRKKENFGIVGFIVHDKDIKYIFFNFFLFYVKCGMDCCGKRENFEIIKKKNSKKCRE